MLKGPPFQHCVMRQKLAVELLNNLTKDIAKLDAQMGKSAKSTNQRRSGARQATQIGGAVISGIFPTA